MCPVFRSKNELVYDAVRRSIIHGELEPGSRVVIDDLAAGLKVSQIPVREALRQLEADGFVSIEPHVGATVTPIHSGLIFEVFGLLEALEIISSRAACQQMSKVELDKMTAMIRQMDNSIGDPNRWSEENKGLHQFVCECAAMPLVMKIMQKTLDHWERLHRYYFRDVFAQRIRTAQQEHWQILEAFRSRDPDTVEHAILAHNRSAREAYTQNLQITPQTE